MLVEKAKTISLRLSLELIDDPKDKRCLSAYKPRWNPPWHEVDIVLWSTRLFYKAHLKELGPVQNWKITTLQSFTTFDLL